MQKSHLRIEADAFRCRDTIIHHQRIEKRHQGIDRVGRRTPVPTIHRERIAIFPDHPIEGGEIFSCRLAFNATQRVKVVASEEFYPGHSRAPRLFPQCLSITRIVRFPPRRARQFAGSFGFFLRPCFAQSTASCRVAHRFMLRATQQHIPAHRAFNTRLESVRSDPTARRTAHLPRNRPSRLGSS